MNPISPMTISIRAQSLEPRSIQAKPENPQLLAERTQALAQQLDDQLTKRLFAIRESVKAENPTHLGQTLDITA